MANMTTLQILQGIKTWVTTKLNLKQDVINDLANIRSGAQAGSTAVQPAELSAYFNDASYDNNTHRINFYHGQTVVAYVDASPFIIDGMVDDVRIENGYLVIDFNTASGKQDISIPLTDIFNPNNYYNKTQTDGLLAQKQDVIQDLADIRSGASAGSTAVQPSTLNNVVKDVVAESGVYDVSANNDNTKFGSLNALLSSANLNTLIPTAYRKGGMSIKFVLSSDNKYVQYRLMSDTFNTTVANWQGVDDEPTADSKNLVKSGGVAEKISRYTIKGQNNTMSYCIFNNLSKGHTYRISLNKATWNTSKVTVDSTYTGFGISFNGVSKYSYRISQLRQVLRTYEFTLEEDAYLKIALRADDDEQITVNIEDVTYTKTISDGVLCNIEIGPLFNERDLISTLKVGEEYVLCLSSDTGITFNGTTGQTSMIEIGTNSIQIYKVNKTDTFVNTDVPFTATDDSLVLVTSRFQDDERLKIALYTKEAYNRYIKTTPQSLSGDAKENVRNNIEASDIASNSNIFTWLEKTIHIDAGKSHSSDKDQILIDAKAGDSIVVYTEGGEVCYLFDKDKAAVSYKNIDAPYVIFPNISTDVRYVGIYCGTNAEARDVIVKVNVVSNNSIEDSIDKLFTLVSTGAEIVETEALDSEKYYNGKTITSNGVVTDNNQRSAYNDTIIIKYDAIKISLNDAYKFECYYRGDTAGYLPGGFKSSGTIIQKNGTNKVFSLKLFFDNGTVSWQDLGLKIEHLKYSYNNIADYIDNTLDNKKTVYYPNVQKGTVYIGNLDKTSTYCLSGTMFVPAENHIDCFCANDLSIRITEYDENLVYIKSTGYAKISGIDLDKKTKFVKISASYSGRGYGTENPITELAYSKGDFGFYYDSNEKLRPYAVKDLNKESLQMLKAAKTKIGTYGAVGENMYTSFCLITDTHSDFDRIDRWFEFGNEPSVDVMLHCGDIVEGPGYIPFYNWKEKVLSTSKPVLAIAGNHEFNYTGSFYYPGLTDSQLSDWLYDTELVTHNGETHPVIGGVTKNYFYKDVTKNNYTIRVIGIYQFEWNNPSDLEHNPEKDVAVYTQEQIDWLVNLLQNTPNNYGVIVLSHAPLGRFRYIDHAFNQDTDRNTIPGTNIHNSRGSAYFFARLVDAFVNGGEVNIQFNQETPDGALNPINIQTTFIGGGNFIANICGHSHTGGIGYFILDGTGDTNYRMLIGSCGIAKDSQNTGWWGREEINKLQDNIHLIVYDNVRDKLKVVKVGATINNDCVEVKSLTF